MVEMSNRCLKTIIEKFKNQDMGVFETLYDEFKKLIMFYSVKLYYDDAASDLTLFLIELFYQIDLRKFESDDSVSLKKYIAAAIRNQYILLSQQRAIYQKMSNKLYDSIDEYQPAFEERVSLIECINILSEKQKMIIIYRYIYGYTNFEISALMGISRQAVNQLKNRALLTLKEFLLEDGTLGKF